jgi:DNA-directed RNA polymerase subunit omega
MARITIDDCVDKVENQFDLTLLVAQRATQISEGSKPRLVGKKDKAVVIALREIAAGVTDEAAVLEEERAILDANRTIHEIRTNKKSESFQEET